MSPRPSFSSLPALHTAPGVLRVVERFGRRLSQHAGSLACESKRPGGQGDSRGDDHSSHDGKGAARAPAPRAALLLPALLLLAPGIPVRQAGRPSSWGWAAATPAGAGWAAHWLRESEKRCAHLYLLLTREGRDPGGPPGACVAFAFPHAPASLLHFLSNPVRHQAMLFIQEREERGGRCPPHFGLYRSRRQPIIISPFFLSLISLTHAARLPRTGDTERALNACAPHRQWESHATVPYFCTSLPPRHVRGCAQLKSHTHTTHLTG